MTFTKDVPTVPGDYRWRRDINDAHPLLIEIYNSGDRLFAWREGVGYVESKWHAWGGEWCRLVPADEIGKAWDEGFNSWPNGAVHWEKSRAKHVMEGRE